MSTILRCGAFFALIGACFGAAAIRAQIVNPTYAILTLEQYRAYYAFYMLGTTLDQFARLGVIAGAFLLLTFLLWAGRACGLSRFWSYSRGGERFSYAWRALAVCNLLVLGFLWQAGALVIAGADLVGHRLGWLQYLLLVSLVALPAFGLGAVRGEVPEHRVMRWPLGLLFFSGTVLALQGIGIVLELSRGSFLIPPLVSTYYGPWSILAWGVGTFGCFGLVTGSLLLGLSPAPECEPDSLKPVERRRVRTSLLSFLLLGTVLLATYPVYLVPRYQIGQNLARKLRCLEGEVPGRTVVWLDKYDPPHTLGPFTSLSTDENLARVAEWLTHAPVPSALTRPAVKILADHALWLWRPEEALGWLEVHRRRQRFSNLNRAFLEVVESSKPGPAMMEQLDTLLNPDRFAWPGPGSRLELAAQLRRYGRSEEASGWEKSGVELGGRVVGSETPSGESLSGRILVDGRPLPGARVALFRGDQAEDLLQRTREHVEGEKTLMDQLWRPTYYQYLDLTRLTDFYAVESTDSAGRFLFQDAEPGLYRLAVRVDEPMELEEGGGLVKLAGEEINLGDFNLREVEGR